MLNWDDLDEQTNSILQRRQQKKAGEGMLTTILPFLLAMMAGRNKQPGTGGIGGVSGMPPVGVPRPPAAPGPMGGLPSDVGNPAKPKPPGFGGVPQSPAGLPPWEKTFIETSPDGLQWKDPVTGQWRKWNEYTTARYGAGFTAGQVAAFQHKKKQAQEMMAKRRNP